MSTAGFCTVADVRAIVDTDVTDAEISQLIDECGVFITEKLGSSVNALILRAINRAWTAYRCLLKDPNALTLGDYRGDRTRTIELLKDELDDMIKTAGGGIGFRYGYEQLPRSYIAVG